MALRMHRGMAAADRGSSSEVGTTNISVRMVVPLIEVPGDREE